MGFFKNLKTVKLKQDFVYLGAGSYWMRVDSVTEGENRKMEKNFIVNLTVVKVLPRERDDPIHSVGQEISHYIKVSGNEYAEANVADFFCGVMGCKPEELTDGVEEWAIDKSQPLKGMVVELRNRVITTKKGNLFTSIHYVREVPAEEVLTKLDSDAIQRFFPNGYLDKIVAAKATVQK